MSVATPPVRQDIVERLWASIADLKIFTESAESLAHYTSADGAFAILRSGELWARDTRDFDPSHAEYHREAFALDALKRYRMAGPAPSVDLRSALARQLTRPTLPVSVFAACLSFDLDSAALWQRFGCHGRGASLVVNPTDFSPRRRVYTTPCIYDLTRQRDVFGRLVEACDSLAADVTTEEEGAHLCSGALSLMNLTLQSFKRWELRDERECRYIYVEYESQLHQRFAAPLVNLRAIPATALGSPSPFVALGLGPLCSTPAHMEALRRRLPAGYTDLPVIPSSITPSEFLRRQADLG